MRTEIYTVVLVFVLGTFNAANASELTTSTSAASQYNHQDSSQSLNWSLGVYGGTSGVGNHISIVLEKKAGDHRAWLFEYQPYSNFDFLGFWTFSAGWLTVGYQGDRFVNGTGTYYYTGLIIADIDNSLGIAPTIAAGYQWSFNRVSLALEGGVSLRPISMRVMYRL